jgi:hypothetical protein
VPAGTSPRENAATRLAVGCCADRTLERVPHRGSLASTLPWTSDRRMPARHDMLVPVIELPVPPRVLATTGRLAEIPGVVGVVLGGSRAISGSRTVSSSSSSGSSPSWRATPRRSTRRCGPSSRRASNRSPICPAA